MVGDALDFLVEGAIVELRKFNGNPIGLDLPIFVELKISETEPGVKGDTSSGSVTKSAKLETGLEIRVPLFLKEGEKVKVSTETRRVAHFSLFSSQDLRVPHFSRSSREVGLSDWSGSSRRADLHFHRRPVIHHDRSGFVKSISPEAAPPPLIGSLHQSTFDRIAMDITQLLAMLVRAPYVEVVKAPLPKMIRGGTIGSWK
jgi:hypothetical protein